MAHNKLLRQKLRYCNTQLVRYAIVYENKKYQIKQSQDDANNTDAEDVDLTEYLTDIYADFLLHFEMSTLIDSLAD